MTMIEQKWRVRLGAVAETRFRKHPQVHNPEFRRAIGFMESEQLSGQ
jgi:hypothetical protein